MGVPQIIMTIMFTINLAVSLVLHGEIKEEKVNFFAVLITSAIEVGILYWGGFFG